MTVGTVLKMNSVHYPNKPGWGDKFRACSFYRWNDRACRVANGLKAIGVGYQEPFAVISHNRGEWMDIYAGCAKGGQIVVPVMFRLTGKDIETIVNHAGCKAFIVEEPFVEIVDSIRTAMVVPEHAYIFLGSGSAPSGYKAFEEWLNEAPPMESDYTVHGDDVWMILYTSGTTGRPKGVVRTHESFHAHYLLNNINMGVRPTDKAMLVMPMCHVNSILYSFSYTLAGAPVFIYNRIGFDPEDMLRAIAAHGITFMSLVPTHYTMMLALPENVRNRIDVSSVRQLLISSAPARKDLKVEILNYFRKAELWEAYGTTEGGLITLLRPEDQLRKIGTIGREITGIDRIKLLDDNKVEVPDGAVGELFYRTPSMFKEYWKDPEKTKEAFVGEWSSAGDMARRDEDGYYILVDRKANMIITGGENVYSSEVEQVLCVHEAVKDVAVIGVGDAKWGEAVKAIVILKDGHQPGEETARQILQFARVRLAGYKLPKSIEFVDEQQMPRTPTGKILHRILRQRYDKDSGAYL